MSSKETIDVLLAAKALVERDLRLGLVKEEELRYAITARKQMAKALHAEGFSNREIAKLTGASPKTIDRDVGVSRKTASNDAKTASNDAPPPENIEKSKPQSKPIEPLPFRNEWIDWTSAVDALAAMPPCGLGVLVGRNPYQGDDMLEKARAATKNLNEWMKLLEGRYGKSSAA